MVNPIHCQSVNISGLITQLISNQHTLKQGISAGGINHGALAQDLLIVINHLKLADARSYYE